MILMLFVVYIQVNIKSQKGETGSNMCYTTKCGKSCHTGQIKPDRRMFWDNDYTAAITAPTTIRGYCSECGVSGEFILGGCPD